MKSIHLRRVVTFKPSSFQFVVGASCHCMYVMVPLSVVRFLWTLP